MPSWIAPTLALIILVVALAIVAVRVIPEYERGVVFRLGRLRELYQPGLKLLLPGLDRIQRVDTRVITLTIPPQEVITRDNVPARVNAVVLFNVTDPIKAVMKVENYAVATSQIAQTTLRSVLGRADLDTILSHRDDLNSDLRKIIEHQTQPWGVDVSVVEIKDVEIPEQMQRAMARQAEAERDRRAKIIAAEGELQAAEKLGEAATIIARSPGALQLRQLQTMAEISTENLSTIVFPIPVELLEAFTSMTRFQDRRP